MDSDAAPEASRAVLCFIYFEDFLQHGSSLPQLFISLAVLTSVM